MEIHEVHKSALWAGFDCNARVESTITPDFCWSRSLEAMLLLFRGLGRHGVSLGGLVPLRPLMCSLDSGDRLWGIISMSAFCMQSKKLERLDQKPQSTWIKNPERLDFRGRVTATIRGDRMLVTGKSQAIELESPKSPMADCFPPFLARNCLEPTHNYIDGIWGFVAERLNFFLRRDSL